MLSTEKSSDTYDPERGQTTGLPEENIRASDTASEENYDEGNLMDLECFCSGGL